MAGKPRKRIDYAGWSVDIFSNDPKIDKLLDAQGWIGFGIYFYLCQMAFGSEGYFYEWCYDLCATTARKMGGGVSAGTVKETVDYCLQIGLFDKGLFDGWGVLTSRGIQKSYLVVLKSKNRRGTEIIEEYWLLDISDNKEYQDVVFVRKNRQSIGENDNSLEGNNHSLGENDNSLRQKESKAKESKVKESKVKKSRVEKSNNNACAYYPNDDLLNQAFADFVDMRKKIKKPMTDRAVVLAMNKLKELCAVPFSDAMDNDLAIKILEQSTMNCWQGLFPLKDNKSAKTSGGSDWVDKWRNA